MSNPYELDEHQQARMTRFLRDRLGLEKEARFLAAGALLQAVVKACKPPQGEEESDMDVSDFPLEVDADRQQARGPMRTVHVVLRGPNRWVQIRATRDGEITIGRVQNNSVQSPEPARVRWVQEEGHFVDDTPEGTPSGAVWAVVRQALGLVEQE